MWKGYDFVAVGRALRELRRQRGWSLRDAEQASGIGRSTISAAERGRQPLPSTLDALGEAYGVSRASLLIVGMGDLPGTLLEAMDKGLIHDATMEELVLLRGAEAALGRPCDPWDYHAFLALIRRRPSL